MMWRKGNPCISGWDCKLVEPLWKIVWKFLKNIKNRITIWSNNSTSGYLSKENKTLIARDIVNPMLTVALPTRAKIWKQTKYSSIDKWVKDVVHRYNGVLLSHKKNKISPFATTWKNLEKNILSEISQTELVWLNGLSASLWTKDSPVQFPVRAHAWVAGQVSRGEGYVRGNHTLMFLSLSFPSLPFSLKINRYRKLGVTRVGKGIKRYKLPGI